MPESDLDVAVEMWRIERGLHPDLDALECAWRVVATTSMSRPRSVNPAFGMGRWPKFIQAVYAAEKQEQTA